MQMDNLTSPSMYEFGALPGVLGSWEEMPFIFQGAVVKKEKVSHSLIALGVVGASDLLYLGQSK